MNAQVPERPRTPGAPPPFAENAEKAASPGFAHKVLDAQRREQEAILAELVRIKGFMPLLMRHRNGGSWSRDERTELHAQLRAIAHVSPYLVLLLLPGSFVLLPVYAWWLDRRRSRRSSPERT